MSMVYISLFLGLTVTAAHLTSLFFQQKKSTILSWEWIVITAVLSYGYLPALLLCLDRGQLFWAHPDFLRNFSQAGFDSTVFRFVFISLAMFFAHLFMSMLPRASLNCSIDRERGALSTVGARCIFFILLSFAILAFYIKYGGMSGFIAFLSFEGRKFAYDEVAFGTGLLSRFDIYATLVAAAALYIFFEGVDRRRVLLLVLGSIPSFLIFYSGSRYQLFAYLLIMIFMMYWFNSYQIFRRNMRRFMFLALLLIPFFAFWEQARNVGLNHTDFFGYTSFFKLVPGEFMAAYYIPMNLSLEGKESVLKFVSQFSPSSLLRLFGFDVFSMGREFNYALRGDVPAVYVASISIWSTFALPGMLGVMVVVFFCYIFLALILNIARIWLPAQGLTLILYGSLYAQSWSFIRLDPTAWFSALWQTIALFLMCYLLVCIAIRLRS